MSERTTTHESVPSLEEQVSEFHDHATRLFLDARRPFSSLTGHESDGWMFKRVRYCSDTDELVTILAFSDDVLSDNADTSKATFNTVVETPLPITAEWPNNYVAENFIIPPKNLRASKDVPYEYHRDLISYTPDGDRVSDPNESAVTAEILPDGQYETPEQWAESSEILTGVLDRVTEAKFRRARQAFPGFSTLLQTGRASERFTAILNLIKCLSVANEVSCEPNPYIRRS